MLILALNVKETSSLQKSFCLSSLLIGIIKAYQFVKEYKLKLHGFNVFGFLLSLISFD
jgi:hypothetical protein